jgi:hypothetical protein
MFAQAIPVQSGDVVTRDGFVFIDLSLPASAGAREKANARN